MPNTAQGTLWPKICHYLMMMTPSYQTDDLQPGSNAGFATQHRCCRLAAPTPTPITPGTPGTPDTMGDFDCHIRHICHNGNMITLQ